VALALIGTASAQQPQAGLDFGVLLSKDGSPEFGYAIYKDFSLKGILGPAFDKVTVSGLYSDREWAKARETYAVRSFAGKDFQFGGFFISVAGGGWYVPNTNGGDDLYKAAHFDSGYRFGSYVEVHGFGDIVNRAGPDLYFTGIGVVVGW